MSHQNMRIIFFGRRSVQECPKPWRCRPRPASTTGIDRAVDAYSEPWPTSRLAKFLSDARILAALISYASSRIFYTSVSVGACLFMSSPVGCLVTFPLFNSVFFNSTIWVIIFNVLRTVLNFIEEHIPITYCCCMTRPGCNGFFSSIFTIARNSFSVRSSGVRSVF